MTCKESIQIIMTRCNYSLRYDDVFTMIHSYLILHSVLRKRAYTSFVSIQMFISGPTWWESSRSGLCSNGQKVFFNGYISCSLWLAVIVMAERKRIHSPEMWYFCWVWLFEKGNQTDSSKATLYSTEFQVFGKLAVLLSFPIWTQFGVALGGFVCFGLGEHDTSGCYLLLKVSGRIKQNGYYLEEF